MNPFGTYHQDEKAISLSLTNAINASQIDIETMTWITGVLENIQTNDLLDILSEDQSLSLVIYIQKLQDPSEVKRLHSSTENDTYESILNEWISTIDYVTMFQSIVNTQENTPLQYNIYMNEQHLNQLLNVTLKEIFPNTFEFNGFKIELITPYIVIDNNMWIEIPLRILNEEELSIVETKWIISSSLTYEEDKGYIVFEKLEIGQIEFDGEMLSLLFELLGFTLENNQLEITSLLSFIEEDINIETMTIIDSLVQITLQQENLIEIEALQETVETIIEALSNLESLPEEIQNGLEAIIDAILTNDAQLINQAFEEYMMTYEALDDTIQSEIQAIIFAYLEENASLDTLLN
jgi:hypothetical protein